MKNIVSDWSLGIIIAVVLFFAIAGVYDFYTHLERIVEITKPFM